MNRRSIMAAIAGFVLPAPERESLVRRPKPVNGECPVCGWKAEPFKPTLNELQSLSQCAPSGGLSVCRAWSDADLPTERRIDCEFCNCTFRQWAEGKEPKK